MSFIRTTGQCDTSEQMPRPQAESQSKYFYWIGGILLTLSLAVRALSYHVVTSDYIYFLSKWFNALQSHRGLTAFSSPFSDYAPLYLYLIKLLTYIPVGSLYSIKTLSILFDVAIATLAYFIIKKTAQIRYTKAQLFFVFALMFSIPSMVLNSSLWGQSDAVYSAGILLCLYFMLQDSPLAAVIAFGLAISVKLQAIFFLPVLIGYCLRKESTAGYLLLVPIIFFLSVIPARLSGGSLSDLLLVYARETTEYPWLSVSAQSIFALLNKLPFAVSDGAPRLLFYVGIGAAGFCSLIIAWIMYHYERISSRGIVYMSLLSVLVLPYLLPRMHERYFYLADVLSVIYVFYNPRLWYIPVLVVGASVLSYMPYLSQVSWFAAVHIDLIYPSLMMLIAIVFLITEFYRAVIAAERSVS